MVRVIETFEGADLNGALLLMDISDSGHVYFGTRFEYVARWMNAPVNESFDFFRNYACLLEFGEIKKGLEAYRAWKAGFLSTGGNEYFWNYFEGKRPQNIGRNWAVIRWVTA